METIQTESGAIPVEDLVRVYEQYRRNNQRNQERRRQFLQTDEGKEYNRDRARAYYDKNKKAILEKKKEQYAAKKELNRIVREANLMPPSESHTPSQ